MQVMLLAARARQTSAEVEELERLCGPGFQWAGLIQLSLHHSLTSLVHVGLGRCCPSAVPPEVRALLQRSSMANALRAFRWMREASRLSGVLSEAGLSVAVLKGVPLSEQLYGSPHARHVGDIDLLLTPRSLGSNIPVITQLLESLGYTRINPPVELTPRRIRSYSRFWKDLTFQHAAEGFDVDLHWRLFNHRMHPANRLLPGARYTSLTALGCTVRVLSLPDQFLHVAAHGVSDAWIYLKSLADVAGFLALLSPAELDAALTRAREFGLLSQVSAAIHLSNSWMGSSVTSALLLPITDPLAIHLHTGVSDLLRTCGYLPTRDDRTPAAWVALERSLVPGPLSLLENFRRFLWRPRVWKRFDLPDSLFWLYPLLGLVLPPRADSLWRRRPVMEAPPRERQDAQPPTVPTQGSLPPEVPQLPAVEPK